MAAYWCAAEEDISCFQISENPIIGTTPLRSPGGRMLVLTRRIGESVKIGDEMTLTVLEIKGTQVRLGVEAPRHIPVHREEVYDRIKRKQGNE